MSSIKTFTRSFMNILSLSAVVFLSFSLHAATNDGYVSYENIVDQLSETRSSSNDFMTSFDDLLIHAGFGLSSTLFTLDTPLGSKEAFMSGMEISLAMDLFSSRFLAETTYRNHGRENLEFAEIDFHEFDLKLVYRPYSYSRVDFRTAFGIAARYMDYRSLEGPTLVKKYTTPSAVFDVGLHTPLSPEFSVGAAAGIRSNLISETIDKFSLNASVRFDAHF